MLVPHSDPGGRFVRAQERAVSRWTWTDLFPLACRLVGESFVLGLGLAMGPDPVNRRPRRYMSPFSSHTLHMVESLYNGSSA